MDDRRHNHAEQAPGGYIIRGCIWCKNDPETAYDYERLKAESEDIEVLITHLHDHWLIFQLALCIITS